jgi:hypothetical protein
MIKEMAFEAGENAGLSREVPVPPFPAGPEKAEESEVGHKIEEATILKDGRRALDQGVWVSTEARRNGGQ